MKKKTVKAWVHQTELSSMLRAQKRGFKDIAEMYGTFWLDEKEARACEPRSRLLACTITYTLP